MKLRISSFTGEKIKELIPQIAALRMEIFSEYPFLYVGDPEYEKRYLQKFATMQDAIAVCAFDGEALIGISTGYPFIYEAENFQQLFRTFQRDPKDYFCFGEFILRKTYRGQGIGKRLFEKSENYIRKLGRYKYLCFFTIVRPLDDPRRPSDYQPLDPFWKAKGFVKHPELIETLAYQEIGESEETPKEMVFWIKKL